MRAPQRRKRDGRFLPRARLTSEVRIAVAVTREERAAWQAAADARGTTLSDVARAAWGGLAGEKKGTGDVPNHVDHRLTIVGPDADVRAFVDRAHAPPPKNGDEPGSPNYFDGPPSALHLSFHAIVPLPPEYSTREYSPAGYDMEIATWGVKWGAYDQKPPIVTEGQAVYAFSCAWGLPTPFLAAASAAWPGLAFLVSYGGEGPVRGRVVFFRGKPLVAYGEPAHAPYPEWSDREGFEEDAYFDAYRAAQRHYLDTHDAWVADFSDL